MGMPTRMQQSLLSEHGVGPLLRCLEDEGRGENEKVTMDVRARDLLFGRIRACQSLARVEFNWPRARKGTFSVAVMTFNDAKCPTFPNTIQQSTCVAARANKKLDRLVYPAYPCPSCSLIVGGGGIHSSKGEVHHRQRTGCRGGAPMLSEFTCGRFYELGLGVSCWTVLFLFEHGELKD